MIWCYVFPPRFHGHILPCITVTSFYITGRHIMLFTINRGEIRSDQFKCAITTDFTLFVIQTAFTKTKF